MSAFRTTLCLLALAAMPGLALAAEDGDAKEGEEVFRARCRQCHQVGPEAKNALGPVLNGVIGRKAGTIEGFTYSPANKKAGEDGWEWSPEKVLKYLENPREAMPGNRMAFVGLRDEQERRDVLAYLKTLSPK